MLVDSGWVANLKNWLGNLNGKRRYPKWFKDAKTDGRQAGLYKRRYVLYDYACEMKERWEWEYSWGIESEFFSENNWEWEYGDDE